MLFTINTCSIRVSHGAAGITLQLSLFNLQLIVLPSPFAGYPTLRSSIFLLPGLLSPSIAEEQRETKSSCVSLCNSHTTGSNSYSAYFLDAFSLFVVFYVILMRVHSFLSKFLGFNAFSSFDVSRFVNWPGHNDIVAPHVGVTIL